MNIIEIIETEVYGVKAYEARCRDCGWSTKRYDDLATAERQARRHAREQHTEEEAR